MHSSLIDNTLCTRENLEPFEESNLEQEEYNSDSPNEIRGKFVGLLLWNPIQSIGHIMLRSYHLFAGASCEIGKEKVLRAHYNQLLKDPSLFKTNLNNLETLSYQIQQLFLDSLKLLLYIFYGIALKEAVSLYGIFYPLQGRVTYGTIESFFYSRPKQILQSSSGFLEFFSFSAPCMQPLNTETALKKRRCMPSCTPIYEQYQPTCTLARANILRHNIKLCSRFFLTTQDKEKFNNLVRILKESRNKIPISTKVELSLIKGKVPDSEEETQILTLQKIATDGIFKLQEAQEAWADGNQISFAPFFEKAQTTLTPMGIKI